MQAIIDIEARLAEPEGAALRAQMRQTLAAAESRLRKSIRQGLSQTDFRTNAALADAFLAAQEILDKRT